MKTIFELNHKYIATLLEDKIVPVLPKTAASTLKIELDKSLELLADKLIVHWRELRRPITQDSYVCTFYVPTNSWQHFKRDYLPGWFKHRYPVQKKAHQKTVKFTRFATYPMADIPLPGKSFGQVVLEDVVEEAS